MGEQRRKIFRLLAMLALLSSLPVAAQTIESLVMPDELVEGHSEFEEECSLCHKAFNRSEQRALCLDCHELVAIDIELNLGFHGKAEDARVDECATCHTDHEGRAADIVQLDESTFDHEVSDFRLLGEHAEAACADCHVANEKFRDAPIECESCHIEDSLHDDKPAPLCTDCHNEEAWEGVVFDHDSTDYELIGKHRETACLDCHEIELFTGTPENCFACHAEDDSHDGRSGEQCENCHNPSSWDDSSFDHKRDTDFPLIGRHDELTCTDCHSEDPFSDVMEVTCVSCHLEDDEHDGHNGPECNNCHTNDAWTEQKFDHDRDTEFALNGSHGEVACNDCHIEPIYDEAPGSDCISCHVEDDPHEGSQGEVCADCHNETDWNEVVTFDHDLTSFPLLGEHDNIDCVDCHETKVFVDAESECVACHIEDDPHDDVFTGVCESCHNPVAWDLWLFDHNSHTDFPLNGTHLDVTCNDCHRVSLSSMQNIGARCIDCHRADDAHDGEFGSDCGRCHSDTSFEEVRSLQ